MCKSLSLFLPYFLSSFLFLFISGSRVYRFYWRIAIWGFRLQDLTPTLGNKVSCSVISPRVLCLFLFLLFSSFLFFSFFLFFFLPLFFYFLVSYINKRKTKNNSFICHSPLPWVPFLCSEAKSLCFLLTLKRGRFCCCCWLVGFLCSVLKGIIP